MYLFKRHSASSSQKYAELAAAPLGYNHYPALYDFDLKKDGNLFSMNGEEWFPRFHLVETNFYPKKKKKFVLKFTLGRHVCKPYLSFDKEINGSCMSFDIYRFALQDADNKFASFTSSRTAYLGGGFSYFHIDPAFDISNTIENSIEEALSYGLEEKDTSMLISLIIRTGLLKSGGVLIDQARYIDEILNSDHDWAIGVAAKSSAGIYTPLPEEALVYKPPQELIDFHEQEGLKLVPALFKEYIALPEPRPDRIKWGESKIEDWSRDSDNNHHPFDRSRAARNSRKK